jgi:hypothetical protein
MCRDAQDLRSRVTFPFDYTISLQDVMKWLNISDPPLFHVSFNVLIIKQVKWYTFTLSPHFHSLHFTSIQFLQRSLCSLSSLIQFVLYCLGLCENNKEQQRFFWSISRWDQTSQIHQSKWRPRRTPRPANIWYLTSSHSHNQFILITLTFTQSIHIDHIDTTVDIFYNWWLSDYFYYKEHLFIVCELLRDNLYEFYKYNRESGQELYFTMERLKKVAKQCLIALRYIHSLGLIHCDLKPENIVIKSYSK